MAKHALPAVSLSELEKIITGYANLGSDVSLDDLSNLIGINKTTISRNNKFLKEVGIIEGGQTKSVTSLGKKLGRAIEHDKSKDIKKLWRKTISGDELLSDLVSYVRINGGVEKSSLSSHVLYSSDQSSSSYNNTGSKAVVNILKRSELIEEIDGKLKISKDGHEDGSSGEPPKSDEDDGTSEDGAGDSPVQMRAHSKSVDPTVTINIELQLPETENPEVYDSLFQSLRENLIEPNDE
jgi:hypothetical protein